MKLQMQSHYDSDLNTRFGDCSTLWDGNSLTVFDCGHRRHAEEVERMLKNKPSVTVIRVVVSHNDSDHTAGVCHLLDWLKEQDRYTVTVYTHQYLRHVEEILDKVDDGRRNRESMKKALLDAFDNIRTIIETAQSYGFATKEALKDTVVGNCTIVGPTTEEFIKVAAQAVDSRTSDNVTEEHTAETVMNAASIQLSGKLDDGQRFLLCGDAHPEYLKNLDSYDIIQFPHHGQLDDAQVILLELLSDPYSKTFLISDNTGTGEKSGGSDELVEWMSKNKYDPAKNTRDGLVRLPDRFTTSVATNRRLQGVRLGGLDCQCR